MDTRTKIVDAAAAAEAARACRQSGGLVAAVTGSFDVLLAETARELAELRQDARAGLLVAVLPPSPAPVLEPRARAEMVAALAVIDYVVVAADGAEADALLAAIEPRAVARLEADHQRRLGQLIEHVHGRHTTG